MVWPVLKWALPLLAILAVAGALTRKQFEVSTVIAAPPDQVWAVLMDTEAYPDWNPVFVEVSNAYEEGGMVRNKVRDPDGKILEMNATVRVLTPETELRQSGGVAGILTFDHRWLLEEVEEGTRVTQYEVDRGIGLWFWNSDWIEPAYQQVVERLEKRVQEL